MNTIGVRELKNNLSRVLKRVQAGERLTVTDRGKAIAIITQPEPSPDLEWAHRMVAEGRATWSGGKPDIPRRGVDVKGRDVAAMILEDRR